jgi:hypothetical protein
MATGRKLVSDVRSMHKLLSTDASITDRAILSEIRSNSLLLIKRETNLRKLWATDTLFTTLPCLELIEVPISECCGYVDPCTIARSKYKLPAIAEGNYQYVIQGVYSINALGGSGTKIKEVTVSRYTNMLQLAARNTKDIYYMIVNDYIYITNPNIQAIRVAAFFTEEVPNELLYPDCCCGETISHSDGICTNPLDKEFPLPGYLEMQTLELSSKKLLGTYFSIKSDITADGIDGQAPNAPNLK